MKNLELSDLENISGGNLWNTAGKRTLCTVILAGVLALEFLFVGILVGSSAEANNTFTQYI